ncbi:uncharacterized protein LOC127882104 isoform X1 [Dreissena polymorpha]|uniref:uncharacterized protein LOC127882104 isoform X1 n=1 Tax=Dreissena polymorpha TaxID=45954 RepID=UPI0022648A89|nr:uncharacterized protein LOC127882104 isoform X1 [Dreissena polymorpha]
MWLYQLVFVFILLFGTVKGIVYLGCYRDLVTKNNRVFPTRLQYSNSNTPEECASRCSQYRYAGVEFEDECFCGDMLIASQRPESECNDKCPGDKSKICGDGNRISVYTNWVCGHPPQIANGYARVRGNVPVIYGSIADVYCNTVFKQTITCLSNKSWEKATCEQTGTKTVSSMSTTRVTTTNTSTHDGSTTDSYTTKLYSVEANPGGSTKLFSVETNAKGSHHQDVGVGIGVAVGLLCAVGAVVVVIVLRRRKEYPCSNTASTSNIENHSVEIGPDQYYEEIVDTNESNTNYSEPDKNICSANDNACHYEWAQDNESETNANCNSE